MTGVSYRQRLVRKRQDVPMTGQVSVFSDPAPRASDANNAVDDLQRLVINAHLPLPLILVGHSNGGIYAVRFAQLQAAEVAGIVLIDPGFTEQQNFSAYGLMVSKEDELEAANAQWIATARKCLALAQASALVEMASSDCLDSPPNADAALHHALNQIESKPAYAKALLSEFESTFRKVNGRTVNDSEVQLLPNSFGDLPLMVLTASRHPASPADFRADDQAKYYTFRASGHDRIAALSKCGRNFVVPNSGHFIQYDHPQLVVATILKVLDSSRHSTGASCSDK
jgi:pimeloyl-ACP methyl ester carboxylesterase